MPNTYFQFKQFTIHQSYTAMKVCTDSCILGAWVAKQYAMPTIIENTLDIGTGTGLLSLMLAQNPYFKQIDAIEIDENAYLQAKGNFEQSNFTKKINLHFADILNWQNEKKFELVICNPPFYENELNSPTKSKNTAKHSCQLLHHQLISKVYHFLEPNGSFWVLLPASYQQRFIDSAIEHQLFCRSKLLIKNTDSKLPFRVIMEFSKLNIEFPKTEEFTIKDKNNNYTSQFTQLLQPYYLNL